ncbi:hypothetical protein [Kitasatospora terrestris]|uniref:Uncharacterized protein n=1 Tax=Kitasatospora terrestris TaxID=258051 RepID=A0ABP9DM48_9ACTN
MKAVRVLAAIVSAVLILELGLSSIAGLLGMDAGSDHLYEMTGLHISRWASLLNGVTDGAAAVALVVGFRHPRWAVWGGLYFALFNAVLLVLRFRHGQHLADVTDTLLFLVLSLVVVVTRAVQKPEPATG